MLTTLPEKIDFLMNLTGTRNSALGRALNYDPSYISRIRTGKRGLPHNLPFIEPASVYFARNIKEDYQKDAAARELGLTADWPTSDEDAAVLLTDWLEDRPVQPAPIAKMLAAISSPTAQPGRMREVYNTKEGTGARSHFFYGNEGKRSGVFTFLEQLAKEGKPQKLLLYSDEDMTWLYEDRQFVHAWADLLLQLIAGGTSIRIIHSIGRNLNDMWEALQKWMPLYMTGAIEPYFYPLLQDGIFYRTLFIAREHSAFVGNSVRNQQGDTLNALITDKNAVQTVEKEFKAYLDLCRPLMEVIKPSNEKELEQLKQTFRDMPGETKTAKTEGTEILLRSSASLILKTQTPYAAFLLKEPRMLAAIEEYMKDYPQ